MRRAGPVREELQGSCSNYRKVKDVKYNVSNDFVNSNPSYTGVAYIKGEEEQFFDVAIYVKSKKMEDCYAKLIFEELFTQKVNKILKDDKDIKSYTFKNGF